MKKTNMSRLWLMGLVAIILTVFPTGCKPQSQSVIEGTWELTTKDETGLSKTFLTFNRWGRLSAISFKIGVLSVTYDNWFVLQTKTTVDGDAVTVKASFPVGSLVYDGTLNSDQTIIEGTVSIEIEISGLNISIAGGSATLTKQ